MNTPAVFTPPTATIISPNDFRAASTVIEQHDVLPIALSSPADVEQATAIMAQAKHVWKAVEKRRVEMKEPYAKLVKNIDLTAARILTPMKEIEATCKERLKRWTYEQELEKQRAEDEAMATAEEEGRETPDLTVATVETYVPEVKSRQLPKVRITDESLLDRKYLIPNIPLIEQDVKSGLAVRGAELHYETIIVNG